jgi:hemerythrin-like domain-containing protein
MSGSTLAFILIPLVAIPLFVWVAVVLYVDRHPHVRATSNPPATEVSGGLFTGDPSQVMPRRDATPAVAQGLPGEVTGQRGGAAGGPGRPAEDSGPDSASPVYPGAGGKRQAATRTLTGNRGGMMADVFAVLGQDHQEVKQMLAELETGPTAASGADDTQLALRKKMAEELIIEESRHEAAEEMHFWPAVRERVTDGNRLADQAIGQENAAKKVLHKLDRLGAADPEFEQLLAEFITAGREHIAFEETQVWPGLRAALSEQEATELGRKLQAAKKSAPTRPHPHTPASPGVLKATGPAAAAADRARDAATGRGSD